MEMFEANPKVGNIRNNGPEMLKKAIDAAESGALMAPANYRCAVDDIRIR
jgi:hypothetical protein